MQVRLRLKAAPASRRLNTRIPCARHQTGCCCSGFGKLGEVIDDEMKRKKEMEYSVPSKTS